MRRPRNKLEVSTFPFLAVLLCAMGSLILILMVFDRRAKLAANERNRMAFEGKKPIVLRRSISCNKTTKMPNWFRRNN